MSVSVDWSGFEVRVLGLELTCYIGDFYVRIPLLFEVAWNSTGIYFDRVH